LRLLDERGGDRAARGGHRVKRATKAGLLGGAFVVAAVVAWIVVRDGSEGEQDLLPEDRFTRAVDEAFARAPPPSASERRALRRYGLLAFDTALAERSDVFVVNADGSGLRNLTARSPDDAYPDWSPDGRRIVFASRRAGSWDIYSMDADGTRVARLTRSRRNESFPSWSPHGERIAFEVERPDGFGDSHVMRPDGSAVRRVATGAWVTWSPDGKKMAFIEDATLFVAKADGSGQVALADADPLNPGLEWSPDGRRIVFHEPGGGILGTRLSIVDVDTADPNVRPLTGRGDQNFVVAWLPNGLIAFQRDFEHYVVRPDGSGLQRLHVPAGGSRPVWSPDAERIAYAADPLAGAGGSRLYVTAADGRRPRRLITARGPIGTLVWQPARSR
jgi:Tol biopolymer transport system component